MAQVKSFPMAQTSVSQGITVRRHVEMMYSPVNQVRYTSPEVMGVPRAQTPPQLIRAQNQVKKVIWTSCQFSIMLNSLLQNNPAVLLNFLECKESPTNLLTSCTNINLSFDVSISSLHTRH